MYGRKGPVSHQFGCPLKVEGVLFYKLEKWHLKDADSTYVTKPTASYLFSDVNSKWDRIPMTTPK